MYIEQINKNIVLKDYESTLGPKLILIADKPLEKDKDELFNSLKGISYLSACFKSKFKSAETHICAVHNTNKVNFSRATLIPILEFYHARKTLEKDKLVIGFIGQRAFESFKLDYNSSIDFEGRICTLKEYNNTIEIFSKNISIRDSVVIPYVILPDVNEDYSEVDKLLNNTSVGKALTSSPYCNTKTLINKFNTILELYNEGIIKGFRFNSKINKAIKKTEYLKIYDAYTNVELLYSPFDDNCINDSEILKNEFKEILRKVLLTVPVFGDNITEVISSYKYYEKDTKTGITKQLPIRIINEEEGMKVNSNRASFVLKGDENNPNGEKSAWYDKWYNEVFKPVIKKSMKEQQILRDCYNIDHRYEWVYDIEVFKYDWLFVAKTLDKKNTVICWNDADKLREWIKDKILIGFNNSGYDDTVIKYAMIYPYAIDGIKTVKEFSDALIGDEEVERFPRLKDKYIIKEQLNGFYYNNDNEIIENVIPSNFISWDIALHLPFDIRRNSLKKLTMSVLNRCNYDSNVPFDIQTPLTPSERLEVEKYCEMDVDNTLDLFLPDPEDIKKKEENPKHKMREFAKDSYDIKWNLIVEYKMKAMNLITKSASFAGKVLCGENAKPNLKNTSKVIDGKNVYYSIPELAMKELAGTPILDFYLKNQTNPHYITEKFEYHLGGDDAGHLYQFGFGGLHQALEKYGSTNLVNMDVASLYPSLLIQYDLMSRGAAANPDSYKEVYNTRIAAKHDGKTLLNLGLKLVLNSAIGAMLSNFNPLYDTWSNSTVCVHGQLLLFILVKRLYDAGFNIVQTNTDGIMIERQENVDFMLIAEQWMKETRLVLEFDEIAILQQNNVNNYYCEFTNGKIKSKGFYLSNEKYGKATSKILCNLVTNKPLLEGTEPRDYVIYKRHGLSEICDGETQEKLEGRSLAFIVGYENDLETKEYISMSRNEKKVPIKDAKGKQVLDENGEPLFEYAKTISKINGFTKHMKLIDDVNRVKWEEINTDVYVNFAKNLLDESSTFGPYYDENYSKSDLPTYCQALNPLKDNLDEYPTKAGVYCQNLLYECDYLTKEEQEELIEPIKDKLYRVVWSGNRSYHIVVRLNKPIKSTAYKTVWYHLMYKLGLTGADEMCCLPNKYTRVPGQINPKTGNEQLLYCEPKYEWDVDELLEDTPKLKEEVVKVNKFTGKITLDALKRHINRQDWTEGNRFVAVQKLSPVLISQVSLKELLELIPAKLEKNHIYVLRAKYHYFEKNKEDLIENTEDESI